MTMNKVYFISEKNLRAQSLINDNVDSTYLNSAILTAQTTNLKEVIGSTLYKKIEDLVISGDIKTEEHAIYQTLLDDYIQPYLINRIMSDICVPLHYKARNAGIVVNADQHFQSASLNEVEYVKNYYEHLSVFNANRVIEFIIKNKDIIPECDENWIKMSRNTTKSQIYFRK